MLLIFSLRRINLPFSLVNQNRFSMPYSIELTDHIMWLENNALSLLNLVKEVL